MATPIAMPRQGQSVESCVILEWFKQKGEKVNEGENLFSYETDKASFEHESPVSGTLLETFFDTDADVPVLTNVAVIGDEGESVDEFRPDGVGSSEDIAPAPAVQESAPAASGAPTPTAAPLPAPVAAQPSDGKIKVSPRARKLAEAKGVAVDGLGGTGPNGRVIERDVAQAAVNAPMTPTARARVQTEGLTTPTAGTGIGRRIRAEDLVTGAPLPADIGVSDGVTSVKMTKIRTIIADRMTQSLQQSAQLTMNASADATGLMAYRATVKANMEKLGIASITINDLVAFALTRTLPRFPDINALFMGDHIDQYEHVHLAVAIDTPRGLMVPVVRYADMLPLNELAKAIKSVASQCIEGTINPDLLQGGTITLSNVGMFGVESFTPVLNPPQVALLGVNTITPKPVMGAKGEYEFHPHIGLSLTIDHRGVDGAPGAKFLKALVEAIENIALTLSL